MLRLLLPTLLVIGISGCSGADVAGPPPSTLPPLLPGAAAATTSKTAEANTDADYRRLLLTAADLSDADDTFSLRPNGQRSTGLPGANAFFVNAKDTRAISDSLVIYPDAATATDALRQASGSLTTQVTGGAPAPAPVGADGIAISGVYPDDQKAVTLLLFTEGRALVRLEFQSATDDATTDRFVTSIGKMQQIALRVGLTDPQ